jgi:hypothetical protein
MTRQVFILWLASFGAAPKTRNMIARGKREQRETRRRWLAAIIESEH